MPATDTTPAAAAVQMRLYRSVGPSRRVQIAVELSDAVRETTMAGIRRRHPGLSEREWANLFLALIYSGGRVP